jgi:hypothetical protein
MTTVTSYTHNLSLDTKEMSSDHLGLKGEGSLEFFSMVRATDDCT